MSPPHPFTMSEPYITYFWRRVNKTDTCWLWTANLNKEGYGKVTIGTRTNPSYRRAHNVAWVILRGAFPPGLEPDHTCNVNHCVNPDHLEWVTSAENSRRRNERYRNG